MSVIILQNEIYFPLSSYTGVAFVQRTYRWMNNITNEGGGGSPQQGETIMRQSETYWNSSLFSIVYIQSNKKRKKKNTKNRSPSFSHLHLYVYKYLSFILLQCIAFVIVQECDYCSFIQSIYMKTINHGICTDFKYENIDNSLLEF
jgi:hypothetical protein